MRKETEWIMKMTEKEDGKCISVGGWVTEIKYSNPYKLPWSVGDRFFGDEIAIKDCNGVQIFVIKAVWAEDKLEEIANKIAEVSKLANKELYTQTL